MYVEHIVDVLLEEYCNFAPSNGVLSILERDVWQYDTLCADYAYILRELKRLNTELYRIGAPLRMNWRNAIRRSTLEPLWRECISNFVRDNALYVFFREDNCF